MKTTRASVEVTPSRQFSKPLNVTLFKPSYAEETTKKEVIVAENSSLERTSAPQTFP